VAREATKYYGSQLNLYATQPQLQPADHEHQKIVCYCDAEIRPDVSPQAPARTGIGIYIVNHLQNTTYTISSTFENCSSVLMAEATALSFTSILAAGLGLQSVLFYTDNQTLVDNLQKDNLDRPPDWRIKPFTQIFCNNRDRVQGSVLKIDRKQNVEAHSLARQALSGFHENKGQPTCSCSNLQHVSSCPLKTAIKDLSSVCNIIAASCC